TEGVALPTTGRSLRLRAANVASYCSPTRTRMRVSLGSHAHGSFEFTVLSNSTVTQRSAGVAEAMALASAALFSRRMPHTFSHALRYSGTSGKVNANAASETPRSLAIPSLRPALIARPPRTG